MVLSITGSTPRALAVLLGLLLGSGLSGAARAADDQALAMARALFQPVPETPVALPGNPATPARVELGQLLYTDPRLSASHRISCASCHGLELGGADLTSTSLGHRWSAGARNSPTVFNAVFNAVQFWDGRAPDLEAQAKGPIENPVEMAASHALASETLARIPGYAPLFERAFPGESQPITIDNVARAIAVFEATLTTPGAPFDDWLRGDAEAMTPQQQRGLSLFVQSGCAGCHGGVNLGGQMITRFGSVADPGPALRPESDKGRMAVTGDPADEYAFKVPTLRNVALTPPYFHTGQVWDLGAAVEVMGRVQLGREFAADEIDAIVAFLESLTGETPRVEARSLPTSVAGTPRPQL